MPYTTDYYPKERRPLAGSLVEEMWGAVGLTLGQLLRVELLLCARHRIGGLWALTELLYVEQNAKQKKFWMLPLTFLYI